MHMRCIYYGLPEGIHWLIEGICNLFKMHRDECKFLYFCILQVTHCVTEGLLLLITSQYHITCT